LAGKLDNEIRIVMLELYHRIMIFLDKLKSTFDDLFEIILESNKGKISHFILTPEQLENNLKFINNHFKKSETIPDYDVIYELYEIIKIKYAITNDKIIFEIEIPILFKNKYNLYNFYKLPKITESNLIFLNVKDNIAIEENNMSLYYFENGEVNNCINYKENKICIPISPIYHYNNSQCEIQIIKNSNTSNCKQTIEPMNSIWINVNNEIKLFINMHTKVIINDEYIDLCNSGILRAKNELNIITDKFKFLMNTAMYQINSNSSKQDFFYVHNYTELISNDTFVDLPIRSIKNFTYKFDEINRNLKNIKLESYLPIDLSEYASNNTIYILISISILIYIYIKIRKSCKINYHIDHDNYFKKATTQWHILPTAFTMR
jgi:hypothetical protein